MVNHLIGMANACIDWIIMIRTFSSNVKENVRGMCKIRPESKTYEACIIVQSTENMN